MKNDQKTKINGGDYDLKLVTLKYLHMKSRMMILSKYFNVLSTDPETI